MKSFVNSFYDGEDFITFDIVRFEEPYREITLAVTDRGKVSVITYDVFKDRYGRLYFEHVNALDRVYLEDLEVA